MTISGVSTTATFALLSQATLTATANPSSPVAGQSVVMGYTGGTDGLTVTYSLGAGAPSDCVLLSGVLSTHNMAIACPVTATMPGNTTYASVTSLALTVTFVPGPVSATASSVVVTFPNEPANGTSCATVTVTLEDQYGNVTPGLSVSLTTIGSSSVYTNCVAQTGTNAELTGALGVATFYVADHVAQIVEYGASIPAQSTSISGSSSSTATFGFLTQSGLTESANPANPTVGQTAQMSAVGGSGTGAITFGRTFELRVFLSGRVDFIEHGRDVSRYRNEGRRRNVRSGELLDGLRHLQSWFGRRGEFLDCRHEREPAR
jgi:hypothetical protein